MTVIFRWADVDHVPLYEGNIFVDNDDHWWGSRCGFTDRLERGVFELTVGAPTCLLCIHAMQEYALKYGRAPDLGAHRLVPLQARLKELASRLELNHGPEESTSGAAQATQAEDYERAVGPGSCDHRAH